MEQFISNLANGLLDIIFGIFKSLINILLYPINALLETLLPNFSNTLERISSFFDYICQFPAFIFSYLGLKPTTLSIIVLLMVSMITISLSISAIKHIIKWVGYIK